LICQSLVVFRSTSPRQLQLSPLFFGSGRSAKVCLRVPWLPVPQASVRRLDRQAASLPEVFCPFDGCMTAALLPSASEFAVPEFDSSPFDGLAATLSTSRVRVLPVESGLFSLRPFDVACFALFHRRLDLFGRFAPTVVTCRAFSIPAPSLGFAPSESVLAVSRTPLGLPCPSFPSSLRLGIKASPPFLLFASGVALYARPETSSFHVSTASLAAPGSASSASASLQTLSIGSAGDVTPTLPAQFEKRRYRYRSTHRLNLRPHAWPSSTGRELVPTPHQYEKTFFITPQKITVTLLPRLLHQDPRV